MTPFLLRCFVRDWKQPDDPKVRAAVGRLSGLVGIVCNLLLFAGKLLAGTVAGSVSITADAMNNLSDASSSIVTLVGFKLAEKPPDQDHPYGHARYEYLSGLTVAALIVVIGFELAKSSVGKIFHPAPVDFSIPVAAVLAGSILMKVWMAIFNRNLSRRIQSTTLAATAADSRNDAIATGAVLLELIVGAVTKWQIDGYMGLLVALFILYSGASLARQTISPLLGEAASPELRGLITDIVARCPKVLGYHDLMVHDYGPGQRFASIHVEMDRREDPLACHELIDAMERECLEKHNVHLVIHFDPVDQSDSEWARMRSQVESLLRARDPRVSVHDFHMVRGDPMELRFDVVIPADLLGQEAETEAYLLRALAEHGVADCKLAITFDLAPSD